MRALVIVDMLNDFVEKTGALYIPGAELLVDNILKLRNAIDRVVYANDSHTENDPEFKIYPKHCVVGTHGAQIYEKLPPAHKTTITINKQNLSMFSVTDTDKKLRELKINELYIVGVATEYCVKAATLDALKLGYAVYIVSDTIAGLNNKDTIVAIEEMQKAGANMLTTNQVLDLWKN